MFTKQCVAACGAILLAVAQAQAEQFVLPPAREVGPFIINQTNPAPSGGWQLGDDRTLNASVVGQGGWTGTCSNQNYDQEITAGIAHSGGHGWRLSNWYHNGCVNHVISPGFAPVGEPGATTIINGGGTGPLANSVVYEFWFRSASTVAEPGTYESTTITDYQGRRMTYLGFFDELPGAGNGCPGDGNCFHLDASGVTDGGTPGDDNTVVFDDNYSPPLHRGQWYRVHIDATFNPTTNAATRHNDVVNYRLYDAAGNQLWSALGVNTWEDAYYQGHYGSNPGDKVASTNIAYRISADPDSASQSNGDTYAVGNRPHGMVFDDLSVQPGNSQQGYATSFDYDRYVAKTGNDSGDCSNELAPCLTITYAIAQSNPYDTIHVGKGMYAENSAAGQNLIIAKPVAIQGAQVGVDARTRDVGGGNDGNETILVPALADAGLTLGSLGDVSVVQINSSGVSLDGLVIDGDNSLVTSPITLNGTNPDADSGIIATGSNITVQNLVIRNVGGAGIFAFNDSGASGDNLIQLNRFTNITNPSTWGLGIYAGYNFYAQISDNLMDQVRVGVQSDENNSLSNPGSQAPVVQRNEIHATRIGIFHNLFYGSATTYTLADNTIVASPSAGQSGQWKGIQIESMQSAQTVIVQGNIIDGSALAGIRSTSGYVLNNWTSSQSATTAIDGGMVENVDVGVLATDATNYTGPVNGALVTHIAFTNIGTGAVYVEDTNEVSGAPAITIGTGNTYTGVAHELVLSGAAPAVNFSGIAGVGSVLVRAAGNYFYANLNGGPCNVAQCTVNNASINAGIVAVKTSGTAFIEQGTFDEMGVIGTGKDGLRLTAADPNNRPTLTRLAGGPNQPVLVVAGTPFASPGAAPTNVTIDHLNFAVDKVHAAEGVLANGFVDGLAINDNQFVQSASATSGSASYRYTNAISINIDPQHNSLGLPRVDGSNVTIQANTISGSATPNATKFRAGIAMDAGVGTIANNTSVGLNHDAIVRFATTVPGGGNGVSINGNTFNGGGLEFDAPNAGVTPIAITGNAITAAPGSPLLGLPQTLLEADISVLRLIDNFQKLPVSISGNTVAGYANGYRGALVENFPNTTFSDNTFTPLAGAAEFVSLVISNKEINTDNPAEPPYPMTLTALHNTFNGSGAGNAGRAVELIDDNDANGNASFGTLSFGDNTAANANAFDANHKYYFNLVDQNCDTRVPPGNAPQCAFLDYNDVGSVQNTKVRPFRGNVYAINNQFGSVAPRAMSPLQQARLNQQTNDINDDANLGYVDYGFTGAVVLRLQGPVANVQVGAATPYSAELTNTGAALTENVLVQLSISRTNGIQPGDIVLQYDAGGGNYQPIPLSTCGANLCGTFGPQPGGFPVGAGYDVLTNLRDTFAVADTYSVQAIVQGVGSNVIYAADTLSTQVVQSPASINLTPTGPQTAMAGITTPGYSARLTNTGGATAENVVLDFSVSRAGGISAGDLTIEYFDGSMYQTIPLSPCGANLCGSFGGAGFPVSAGYDATTALQIVYVKSGAFTMTTSVDGVSTATAYSSAALTVTVAPGAAANIAANSATTISGTAGTPASPLPSVIVTDANGNPVSGYTVNITPGANSGTLSGTSPATDANGIATLGGWTLGTAAAQTVSAAGTTTLVGNPVVFTANVTAQFDLAVNITDNRTYVQYGHVLDYVIVVSNAGPSAASNAVTDNLPPELDVASASWVCFSHTTGATCTASGSGNLSDTPSVPANGSVTYVLSAAVRSDPGLATDVVVNQVSVATTGDSNSADNTATSTTQIVIFRDGFEAGGNGAQGIDSTFQPVATLDDVTTLTLNSAQAPVAKDSPLTWIRALQVQGREVFRIDVLGSGTQMLVRIVSSAPDGIQTHTVWTPWQTAALGMAGSSGKYVALLAGADDTLQAVMPAWVVLPLEIRAAQ